MHPALLALFVVSFSAVAGPPPIRFVAVSPKGLDLGPLPATVCLFTGDALRIRLQYGFDDWSREELAPADVKTWTFHDGTKDHPWKPGDGKSHPALSLSPLRNTVLVRGGDAGIAGRVTVVKSKTNSFALVVGEKPEGCDWANKAAYFTEASPPGL